MIRSSLSSPFSSDISRGIGLMFLAIFLLSTLDATVKWLTGGHALVQIIFFRNLFGMVPVLVLIHRQGGLSVLRTRRPLAHLARLLLALTTAFGFFWALSRMELADATAIVYTVPLFIMVLSVLILGERPGIRRWSAVMIGLVGVLVVIRPGTGVFDIGALGALLASVCYAGMMISNRVLRKTETTAALIFSTTVGTVLVTLIFLPWVWITPSLYDLGLFMAAGFMGTTAHILLIQAFRIAPAAIIAPFEYTALVWATVYGFLVFGDLPDHWTIVGAALVAVGGIYLLRRETRDARRIEPV